VSRELLSETAFVSFALSDMENINSADNTVLDAPHARSRIACLLLKELIDLPLLNVKV
jgi:hypothetical protein